MFNFFLCDQGCTYSPVSCIVYINFQIQKIIIIIIRNCLSQSTSVDMTDLSWKQAQLSLSKGGLGLRSLVLLLNALYR